MQLLCKFQACIMIELEPGRMYGGLLFIQQVLYYQYPVRFHGYNSSGALPFEFQLICTLIGQSTNQDKIALAKFWRSSLIL
jgi:hypothetical protein